MKKIILTAAVVAFMGGVAFAQTPESTNTKKTEIKRDQDGKKEMKECSKKKSCCAKKNTTEANSAKKSCCAKKAEPKAKATNEKAVK